MKIRITDKFTFSKLLRFAIPSIVMVIFTSIYGVVDGLFVSRFGGDGAFTAINLVLPAFYLLGSVGFLLGSGGCALIAKLFGEGNDNKARRIFCGITVITTGVGLLFTAVTVPFVPQLAVMLGAEGEVVEPCVTYGRIMLIGLVPFILQTFFQYFFAVANRPGLGLAITVAAGLTNALGDFLLIYVSKLGVSGAAAATVLGECVGAFVPLVYFFVRKGKNLYFQKPEFDIKAVGKICANGSSELVTNISVSAVSIIYNMQLLKYIGNAGVEAYGVIMYVSYIFVGCYLGFAVGTTPIIGYNFGAKNKEELNGVLNKSLLFYATAAILLTALAEALAYPLAHLFVGFDKEKLDIATKAIRIFSISFLFSGFNIYLSAFFTALNNGLVSAVISLTRTLVMQIAAVYVMPLIFGVDGIWSATIVAEVLSLALSSAMLLSHRKKYGYWIKDARNEK